MSETLHSIKRIKYRYAILIHFTGHLKTNMFTSLMLAAFELIIDTANPTMIKLNFIFVCKFLT